MVLLTPTRDLLSDGVRDALKVRGGLALPLIETVGADAAGLLPLSVRRRRFSATFATA